MNTKDRLVTCPTCKGTGLDESHLWPDGSKSACERCEGYGTIEEETSNPYDMRFVREQHSAFNFTPEEKQAAQIIDQLCPVFIADTGAHVGPDTFKRLTIRLAELLAKESV